MDAIVVDGAEKTFLALLVGFTALTTAFATWCFRAYQRTL
jgi:hypothetical protein